MSAPFSSTDAIAIAIMGSAAPARSPLAACYWKPLPGGLAGFDDPLGRATNSRRRGAGDGAAGDFAGIGARRPLPHPAGAGLGERRALVDEVPLDADKPHHLRPRCRRSARHPASQRRAVAALPLDRLAESVPEAAPISLPWGYWRDCWLCRWNRWRPSSSRASPQGCQCGIPAPNAGRRS